jgi:putative methionine-R-sulfoxide reductase with GAF domain
LILAAAVVVFGPLIAVSHGTAKVWLCIGLGLVAALNAGLARLRQRPLSGFPAAADHVMRTVAGAGHPVLISLKLACQTTDAESAKQAAKDVRQLVLDTARLNCGLDRKRRNDNRAVVYVWDGGDLVRAAFRGREADPEPRSRWSASDHKHQQLLAWAKVTQGISIDRFGDVKSEKPRADVSAYATYRSFVSIPVVADEVSYGILTLDSPVVNNFNQLDEGTLALLSHILAAAMAHAEAIPRL